MAVEQVILKEDVRKLGDRGDVVSVAAGYARNFLYPRSLAIPASGVNKQQIEEMRAAAGRESELKREQAEKARDAMEDVTIRIVTRAGESGTLFGSVTVRDLADELEKAGFDVDRHDILLDRPIKQTGDYEVRIHLYKDVKQTIQVEVRAEGREDELFGEAKEQAEAEAAAEAEAEAEAAAQEAAEAEGAEGEEAAEAAAEGEEVAETEPTEAEEAEERLEK